MPFVNLALARRIERAWAYASVESAHAHERRRPGIGAVAMPIAGGHAVFLGAGSTLSQAQAIGLQGAVSDDQLDAIEAFFRARSAPVQLEVCTFADASLWSLLGARGYRATEPSHVLVRPIAASESWNSPPEPLSVEIVEAGAEAIFVETILGAFFEKSVAAPVDVREDLLTMLTVPSATCWLARVQNVPAGAATVQLAERTAVFAGDGVLPACRGRGVHDALLCARLAHAAQHGCDLAVTCTQPGSVSQRNAERLGFRIAYARLLFVRD